MGKDSDFDIIYRGDYREFIKPGRWVFIQRSKAVGGWWLGRAWENFFEFGPERPIALREGMDFLMAINRVEKDFLTFDDDFQLE
uniref:LF-82 n=1 Tax=feces metagenome TaxID=1861841 RepID=A0A7M2QNE1_9ZZZZ